jgi:DNA alkylation repair enzyme
MLACLLVIEMPAINISHLKLQTARLLDHFGEPEVFTRELRELLDAYTNRSRRPAETAKRLSLPTYYTPQPVLRQIERELEPLADARPLEAITLTETLWQVRSLESRLLAAHLLGSIPPAYAISVLSRLPEWLRFSTDREIRQALLAEALVRVRHENPAAFLLLLEDWLKSPNQRLQAWSLEALVPLLEDERFENLPAVFRILRPAVESISPSTQLELQACLAALERVSLTETTAFLRDLLTGPSSPALSRFLRRMLPAFSPQLQATLRELLRQKGT